MKVRLSAQVVAFVNGLPPEPRKRLRAGLRGLTKEQGNIVALESVLEGYCRLRVGAYRVVFAYAKLEVIECVFVERRSVVYELLMDELGLGPGS